VSLTGVQGFGVQARGGYWTEGGWAVEKQKSASVAEAEKRLGVEAERRRPPIDDVATVTEQTHGAISESGPPRRLHPERPSPESLPIHPPRPGTKRDDEDGSAPVPALVGPKPRPRVGRDAKPLPEGDEE
jgi:hypothetical protein